MALLNRALKTPSADASGWADVLGEGRLPRFVLICLGVWLMAADSLVTATIMPSVAAELGGYVWFAWATAGFLLGSVVAGASSGRLAERFGLRRGVWATALVYATGCALSAAAPDMRTFLVGRVLQGLGGGWVAGFCSVAIGLLFPDRTLARVFAAASAVWGVATLLGPLLGGLFADAGLWRWAFWSFALQGVGVGLAALRLLPRGETLDRGVGVPAAQLALITTAVAAIGLADLSGTVLGSTGLLALGLGLLVFVVRLDAGARVRLLPEGSADLRTVPGAGYASFFLLTAASMGFAVYGPAILQERHGVSALAAGYIVGLEALAWTVAALLVSGLTGRWQSRMIVAGAAAVAAGVVLSAPALAFGSVWAAAVAGAVLGAGFGLAYSFMSRSVLAALPGDERAIGSAALTTVRLTGSAAGAAACGLAANLAGFSDGLTEATARAAGLWVFVALAPVAVLGVWTAVRLAAARA